MAKRIENLDEEDDIEEERGEENLNTDKGEYVSATEIRERYKRSPKWLEDKHRTGVIQRSKIGAKLVYKESDVIDQLEFEKKDETIVAALAAATALAEQANKNMQTMFELTQKGNKDIVEALIKSLEQLRGYVGELETQNRDMRELSEKQKTEDHLRRLAEIEQEKSQAARDKALGMVQQVALPLIASKLGIPLGPPPTEGTGKPAIDPMITTLAVDWLKGLAPEQLLKMKEVLSPEQFEVLNMAKQVMP